MQTTLELINLKLELLMLLLQVLELGLQGQQMRLDRTWGLLPFNWLRVFSLGLNYYGILTYLILWRTSPHCT